MVSYIYICGLHFVSQNGPTAKHSDRKRKGTLMILRKRSVSFCSVSLRSLHFKLKLA